MDFQLLGFMIGAVYINFTFVYMFRKPAYVTALAEPRICFMLCAVRYILSFILFAPFLLHNNEFSIELLFKILGCSIGAAFMLMTIISNKEPYYTAIGLAAVADIGIYLSITQL